jgi:P pilus assembly chaperone PapD
MRRSTLLLSVIAALLSVNVHAAFDISKKRVYYYADDKGASITVTNTGDKKGTFVASTKYWDDRTKEEGMRLVAYPPKFTLKPGARQTVRLLLSGKNSKQKAPLFYRIGLYEENEGAGAVQLSLSLPLYYLDRSIKPQGKPFYTEVGEDKKKAIAIKNTGNTLLHITGFADASKKLRKLDEFILPGRTYAFITGDLQPPYWFRVAHGTPIELK